MEFTDAQIAQYRTARHGERQRLAEAWGIPYNSLRGAMSRLGAQEDTADAEDQAWMNAPLGRPLDTPDNVILWTEVRERAGLNADRPGLSRPAYF